MDLHGQQHHQGEFDIFAPNHQVKGGKGHAHSDELAHAVLHPGHIVRGGHEQKNAEPEIGGITAEGVDHTPHLKCRNDEKKLSEIADTTELKKGHQRSKTGILFGGSKNIGNGGKGRGCCAERCSIQGGIRTTGAVGCPQNVRQREQQRSGPIPSLPDTSTDHFCFFRHPIQQKTCSENPYQKQPIAGLFQIKNRRHSRTSSKGQTDFTITVSIYYITIK